MNSIRLVNDLDELLKSDHVSVQLSVPELVEKLVTGREGHLTNKGAVVVATGKYTGRSPKDKYFVEEENVKDKIDWGTINQPISPEVFANLYEKVLNYLKQKDEIFVF